MFERFTPSTRDAVAKATEEALSLGHDYIGTEHLLLGVLAQEGGPAAELLRARGVDGESIRRRIVQIVGSGKTPPTGQIPFTPRAKRALERAVTESLRARREHADPEHLLLALAEEDGLAAQLLLDAGVGADDIRAALAGSQAASPPRPVQPEPSRETSGATTSPAHPPAHPPEALTIGFAADARSVLRAAAAAALLDGREEIELRDLLLSLSADARTEALLEDLAVTETSLREAIERRLA